MDLYNEVGDVLRDDEINNSLAPIASLARSVRLMARAPEHGERLDSALDVIEERSVHLKEFLEGYTRFARLPQPMPREVAWGTFLAELREVRSWRPTAAGCGLRGGGTAVVCWVPG